VILTGCLGFGAHTNPIESNILFYTLRILHLGIQLHFVFDGARRLSNGGKLYPGHDEPSELFRDTLTKMGIPWHEAPAEAEAECAKMEIEGIVDGVWSENGDALAFGSKTLIRFQRDVVSSTESKEDVRKSHTHFRIFRLEDLEKKHPGMNRDGFVLHAILNGKPRHVGELYDLGPPDVLAAAELGLGQSLCAAATTRENLRHWATTSFADFLRRAQSDLQIPRRFPRLSHVQDYLDPVVSTPEALRDLPQPGDPFLNEQTTFEFLVNNFQWTLTNWSNFVVPYRIVRALLATGAGEESQNDHFDLKCDVKKISSPKKAKSGSKKMSSPKQATAKFELSNATSLDISTLGTKTEGRLETMLWLIRKANYNKQPSIKSYLRTPDSGRKGKGVAPGRTQHLGSGMNSTPPTPPSNSPSSSNGEGPSERRHRTGRAPTPPSPTPTSRKRKLPWGEVGVPKHLPKFPKNDHGASSSQAKHLGKGKDKEKEALATPDSSAGSTRAQPPTAPRYSEDLYENAEKRPRLVEEPPSTPPAQIAQPADAVNNIVVIYSDSEDDSFGSFPSVAAEQLLSTPPLQRTTGAGEDVIMIDEDEEDEETEYGSPPDPSDFPELE
jgi:XPG I-region